nr:hypothetical protein [Micromonospora sp. DSM 115978]
MTWPATGRRLLPRLPRLPTMPIIPAIPPTVVDVLLVAALSVPTAIGLRHGQGDRPWELAIQAGLLLPLAWRRRAPQAVFAVVAGAARVQWLADVQLPADVGLLVALYNVAAQCSPGRTLVAAAIVE